MKRVIAILILLAVSAAGMDVTGRWSGTFKVEGGDHTIPQLFILKQDGTRVSGTGGPDAQEQYPIENGKVEGDRVTFELTTGEWKFEYDLKAAGTEGMSGDLELKSINDSRKAKVTLNKVR
jgi:hypothetical protein